VLYTLTPLSGCQVRLGTTRDNPGNSYESHSMLVTWLVFTSLGLSWFILGFRDLGMFAPAMVLGLTALVWTLAGAVRRSGDPLNPLTVLIAVSLARFGLQALLIWINPTPDVDLYRAMRLTATDWQFGLALALLGTLSVVAGWLLIGNRIPRREKSHLQVSPESRIPAVVTMMLGAVALVFFVARNATLGDVVTQGTFRSTQIQVGTGPLFYLGLLLVPGSIVLSAHLLGRHRSVLFAISPTIFVFACFFVLGGRVRAIVAVLAALLLVWHTRRGSNQRPRAPWKRLVLWVTITLPMLVVLANVGSLYRGGEGLAAFGESIATTDEYLEGAFFVDIGHLHSLAGATKFGPGELHGITFLGVMSWPLSEIIKVPGRSSGVFIIDELVGRAERPYGLHATLMGDAYLNFGIAGVFPICAALGASMRVLHQRFRHGQISTPMYALMYLSALRLFAESIDKWGESLFLILSTYLLFRLSALMFRSPSTRTWSPGLRPKPPSELRGSGSVQNPGSGGTVLLDDPEITF